MERGDLIRVKCSLYMGMGALNLKNGQNIMVKGIILTFS
jgi:hypothetical protein